MTVRQNRSFIQRRKHDIQPCRLSLGTSAFRSDAFDRSRPRADCAPHLNSTAPMIAPVTRTTGALYRLFQK
jgi:hypothetical protein